MGAQVTTPASVAASRADNSLRDTPPNSEIIQNSGDMSVESMLEWPVFYPYWSGSRPRLVSLLGQKSIELVSESFLADSIHQLDSEAMTELVSNFLSTNHVKNPVLDIDALWVDAMDLAKVGIGWDGRSCLVVRRAASKSLPQRWFLVY